MKRRIFLKNTSSAIIGTTMIPGLMASENEVVPGPKKLPSLLSDLSLTSFERDREETPCLVSNGKGSAWLFSLRRFPWPRQEERISCFQLEGNKWKEKAPVTPGDGFYETPSAACPPGGKPAVAWIEIGNDNQWNVYASRLKTEGFSAPQKVSRGPGKAANPKITAPEKGKILLVWENYHQGKFSVHLSKYRNNRWSPPQRITRPDECCLDPAVAWGKDGKIYLVYGITDGVHQKILVDFKVNNALMGETIPRDQSPTISIFAKGAHPLEKIELLRNSRVLKTFEVPAGDDEFSVQLTDKEAFTKEKDVLYYYVRVTQKNAQLAWSSPVWFELNA